MLYFLYTGNLSVESDETLPEIFNLAMQYELYPLADKVVPHLAAGIDCNNIGLRARSLKRHVERKECKRALDIMIEMLCRTYRQQFSIFLLVNDNQSRVGRLDVRRITPGASIPEQIGFLFRHISSVGYSWLSSHVAFVQLLPPYWDVLSSRPCLASCWHG